MYLFQGRQVLNRAIVSNLKAMFVNQTKSSCFSIATDSSNNEGLEKMNHIRVRLFYIYVSIKVINSYSYV